MNIKWSAYPILTAKGEKSYKAQDWRLTYFEKHQKFKENGLEKGETRDDGKEDPLIFE